MFMLCIISKGEDTKSDPDHDRIISNLIWYEVKLAKNLHCTVDTAEHIYVLPSVHYTVHDILHLEIRLNEMGPTCHTTNKLEQLRSQ